MTFLIYYIECLLGRFINTKFMTLLMLVTLFVLFGWNYENADTVVYIARYDDYELMELYTEPLFTWLMMTANKFALGLQGVYVVVALLFVISLYILLQKTTAYTSTTLSLFMLSSLFFFDVVQLRFTAALVLVYVAFAYYISKWMKTSQQQASRPNTRLGKISKHRGLIFFVSFIILARWLYNGSNKPVTSIVIILYMLLFDYRMMFYSETMDTVYLAVMENNLLLN